MSDTVTKQLYKTPIERLNYLIETRDHFLSMIGSEPRAQEFADIFQRDINQLLGLKVADEASPKLDRSKLKELWERLGAVKDPSLVYQPKAEAPAPTFIVKTEQLREDLKSLALASMAQAEAEFWEHNLRKPIMDFAERAKRLDAVQQDAVKKAVASIELSKYLLVSPAKEAE